MPTLYLIDGYAQFFRAYHAIRTPMTSPVTKEPTNMTFGFIGMLLKLLRGEGKVSSTPLDQRPADRRLGPDYLAVALDVSGDRGTFRTELYEDYKATRSEPPDDLKPQVDRCLAILKTMGVPVLGVEGFEADDVLATIVAQMRTEHPDLRVRLVSKDKDLKQLLGERVELYDVHTDGLIDASVLMAEEGITPSQVVDVLALMGDTVDNIKGVEGVGPKTAAALIAQYGSMEHLIEHAGEVKGKRGEALRAAIADHRLALNRQLVRLREDVPLTFSLDDAATRNLKLDTLLPSLKELGFNRYQDELKLLMGNAAAEPVSTTPTTGKPAAPKRRAPVAHGDPRFIPGGLFDSVTLDGSGTTDVAGDLPAEAEYNDLYAGYRCVRTNADLDELIKELRAAEIIAVDTETTGLSPRRCKLCGVCLSTKPGTGWYAPVRSPDCASHLDQHAVLDALRPILEDPKIPKCGHNLKYDLLVLRNHGVELRGIEFDSMVASYLIDASRSSHAMDALALALLNRTNISIKELLGPVARGEPERTFDCVPIDAATRYAAEDADVSLQLRNLMRPQLEVMGLMELFRTVEMPLVEVLGELEWNGIRVDRAELDRQQQRLADRLLVLRKEIDAESLSAVGRTFNPDSPKQLSAILFNKPAPPTPDGGMSDGDGNGGLGLKIVKRTATGASTDSEVLEKLVLDPDVATPLPKLILEHRELSKLVGTYLVALADEINPQTGRIHASFHQAVAATGRLSSSDPNLQNIPIRTEIGREIRRAFVAEEGHLLVSADYSQIELRLLAHLSRDPALIEAFHEGQDIHAAVAAQVHGVPLDQVTKEQRSGAKMVNFGIVYGVTAFGLGRRLGISNSEAAKIIDDYKRRFAGITTFLQECVEQARRLGYVETMLKRRRPIIDIDSNNPSRRALAERIAINSVVQGSAADLIKLAMVDLHARLSEHAGDMRKGKPAEIDGVRMLLQIHDELVFEAPRDKAEEVKRLVVERMEQAMTLSVPIKADASIAANWFEGK